MSVCKRIEPVLESQFLKISAIVARKLFHHLTIK